MPPAPKLTTLARLGAGLRLCVTIAAFLSPHALMRLLSPARRRGAWGALLGLYVSWYIGSLHLKNELADFGSDDAVALIERWWLHAVMRLCGVTSEIRMPDDLSPPSPCVLTCAPHGVFAVGHLTYNIGRLRTEKRFRDFKALAGGASVLFYTPVVRELLLLLGAREATQETLDRALRSGRSVGLSTGGVWEQLHTSHEQESLSLLPNLGFVRLAMRHGVPLVPTYAFGENALYKTHEVGMGWREWIALRLRVGLPLATGRLGGPFPHAAHHVYALGRPVPTGPPNADPTDAEVVAVLHRWLREMRRLFDEHKDCLPPETAARGMSITIRSHL